MAERGLRANLAEFKNPLAVLDVVLADPEFDAAVEHMLTETGTYDEIVEAMANVSERHGASVKDMNNAIRLRLVGTDREQEYVPGVE